MIPKVLITRPVDKGAIEEVAKHCHVQQHPVDEPMAEPLLAEAMRDVDAVMPCGVRVGPEAIAQALKLRVIANIGAGYDNIDVETCNQRRILVTNTPDVLSEATADLAFALLLATTRRVVEGDRYVREQRWHCWQWNLLWGQELNGRTLGLYGCGRIGQAMARRAHGFSLRLLYHARNPIARQLEKQLGAEWVDRETLLRESDFLSVHVPLTPETNRSLGRSEFSEIKPGSFLINTARGAIVDEEALVEALENGRMAGAGLDVFENEPRVHPRLLEMKNVVLMPHVGSATQETRSRMAMLATRNLLLALKGERPPNLVNPQIFG